MSKASDRKQLTAAINEARKAPEQQALWDRVENLAASLDLPEKVVKAYGGVLADELPDKLIASLGRRAADFHDEWLGEPTPELTSILERVLAADPGADWAFQRLTVALTSAEKWDELLDQYDRALDNARTKSRRGSLLEEAANVAKDFAGDHDRAIGYLTTLQELRPRNKPVALALERLLDKNERWSELIELWNKRLAVLKGTAAREAREHIAKYWLEKLSNPARSLATIQDLLRETDKDEKSLVLLETIVRAPDTPAETREAALALLRERYEVANRESDIVAAIEAAMEFVEADRRKQLRAEAGALLATIGEGAKSFDHFAQLLVQEPGNIAAEEELRHLAHQHNEFERLAQVLAEAAGNADEPARSLALLREAAGVRLDSLRDRAGAIDLLLRAYRVDGPAAEVAEACRDLDALLESEERHAERLDVLDRLAANEERADERRNVLGELAQLAARIGEKDRAAETWKRRIEADAGDLDAITALVDHYASTGDARSLVEALRQRVDAPMPKHQRRADLEWMAVLLRDELEAPERAIEVLRELHERFGVTPGSVETLASLLSNSGRWKEYAELLDGTSNRDLSRSADWLARAGDAAREQLDAPGRAVSAYARGLDIDPHHEACRQGLQALLDSSARGPALDALSAACTRTDEWQQALELVEPRLAVAEDDAARVGILKHAAQLHERRAEDTAAAFSDIRRASVLAPNDEGLLGELERLGAGDADGLCAALRETAEAADDPALAARLRRREGEVQEQRRDDAAAALEAFKAARPQRPDDIGLLDAIARLAARTGGWSDAANATLAAIEREGLGDGKRVDALIGAAGDGDVATLAGALVDEIAAAGKLRSTDAAQLEATVAGLYRDRVDDAAAAEAALRRSLDRVGDDRAVLVQLVELLRREPGQPLYDELHRLAALDADDLDALTEAAAVAADTLDDAARERASLEAVLTRAVRLWRTGGNASGERRPDETANASLDRLAELYHAAGETDRAIAALEEAVGWPVDAERRRALRFRAAELAAGAGNDRRAVGFYRDAFADDANDVDALARMAELYEKLDDVGELLAVRKAQLERATDADTRVPLRLELSKLVDVLEERSGRVDGLRKNLAERPAHPASLDALCDLLRDRARFGEMADVLSEQATAIQGEEPPYAAALWLRCARVCENELSDDDRALGAFRNTAELAPESSEALDGLARLHVQRGEHAAAVPWLQQWLPLAGNDTADVTLRLANAHVDSGNTESAIQCLEAAEARVTDARLRDLLAGLYRDAEAWEPLGRLLTESLDVLTNDDEIIATAREATAIYAERMGAPQRAVTALQSALQVSPDDVSLRTQLAVGLRVAERLDDARAELEGMIEKFGRRRSAQRARVHHELALVARDQDDIDTALAQLELASKMDTGNGDVLRSLAELAREHERYAEAERAYRALLLVARRRDADDPDAVGASEVLFELHYLAKQAGDEDRAAELRESALETAIESDAEITRARRALIAHEDYATLLEVLEERLDLATEAEAKAQTLAYLAETLDKLGRGDESLEALLRALESAPGREDLHDAARAAAKAADSEDRYIDTVADLAGKARRKEDSGRAAVLLWKLGTALERDREDLDGAAEAFARMERTGIRVADALSAQARIHGKRDDTAAQTRALSELLKMVDDAPAESKADALYQLAEIRIVKSDTHADGLKHLNEALSADPRYPRAGEILRNALDAVPGSNDALAMYQSVARRSNDRELMLDCVERRAAARVAEPAELRDAIDTAIELDVPERAESLLTAAVEQARESEGGLAEHVWAPLALAEYKQRRGDFGSAADVVLEAASIGGLDAVWGDAVALAQNARDSGHPDVAARTLSALREHRPEAREAWEPLFQIYSEQGDHGRLETLANELLPSLMDVSERNALRMLFADVLRKQPSSHAAAMELYKDVLLDEPGNQEAATLYEHLLEESGTDEEIIAFLSQRFDEARDSGEPDRVAGAALRLGERMAKSDPGEALEMYRSAADLAPDNTELLAALVELLDDDTDPAERARWIEKLLATSSGAEAAKLAVDLHALRRELGEDDGALRALELGYAAAPESDEIRTQLENHYRETGQMRPLAELLAREAERLDDPEASIPMLMEVAQMFRDMLFDAQGAIDALGKAVEIAPQDMNLLAELVRSLEAEGNVPEAIEAMRAALARGIDDENDRVSVLLMQANAELGIGEASSAVADLEEAYQLAPERASELLMQALAAAQGKAREADDLDLERITTLRLAELQRSSGQEEQCRDTLVEWIGRAPHDREVLHQIADLDAAAEHWDGVVAVCDRLIGIEEGDDQVVSALRLADAAARGGNAGQARAGLETAYQSNPDDDRLREALERIYELAGAFDELAAMALQDVETAGDADAQFDALLRAADLLVRAQNGDGAIDALDRARAIRPDDEQLTLRYIDALIASGRLDEARASIDPMVDAADPRSRHMSQLQLRRARLARAAGDGDGEIDALEKVFNMDRDNGEIAAELARAAEEQNRIPLAIKALRTISLKKLEGPMEPHEATCAEARLELRRGNPGKARMLVRKVVRERPDYIPAIEIMEAAKNK